MINQKILTKQLERSGCRVYIANHGLEAIDFIKTTRYWRENHDIGHDLTAILMDWEMPVCDGLTCTRKLRELEAQDAIAIHLPIIGITANVRQEQIDMAYESGMVSRFLFSTCNMIRTEFMVKSQSSNYFIG